MKAGAVQQWRANFFAGLAIVLPAVISIGVVVWLFGTVSNITDLLLFFLPTDLTHKNAGTGPMYWYWSLEALLLAVLIITMMGRLARYYLGKKIIEYLDLALLGIPLLNKIYSTIKQVNDAFSTNQKSSFQQVVLVEFPRSGCYSVGFVTGEQRAELQAKTKEKIVSVFVPTTPNPTSGFLILVPEQELTKLHVRRGRHQVHH